MSSPLGTDMKPLFFKLLNHLKPCIPDLKPFEKPCILIHGPVLIYRYHRFNPHLTEEPYICSVSGRAHHNKPGTLIHISIRMSLYRDFFPKHRRHSSLAVKMLVSLILGIEYDHTAAAYKLRPCSADNYFITSLFDRKLDIIKKCRQILILNLAVSNSRLATGAPVVYPLILIYQPLLPEVNKCILRQCPVIIRISMIHITNISPKIPGVKAYAQAKERLRRYIR